MYETEEDRKIAREIADKVALFHCYKVEERPEAAVFDFVFLVGDEVMAMVEVKERGHKYGDFPTLMIDLHKIQAGKFWTYESTARYWLIIQWKCGKIGIYEPRPGDILGVSVGGREDRGDTLDRDLVIHIPIDKFRILGEDKQTSLLEGDDA